MKKLPILLTLIFVTTLSFSSIVYAESDDPGNPAYPQNNFEERDSPSEKDEKVEERDQKKQEQLEFKCKTSSSKMDKLEAKYRENFNKHQETYQNMVGRIAELLDEMEEKDYDVDSARAAVEVFSEKLNLAEEDFNNFSFEFQQAKDQLCEDDVSGYRQSLNQARNQLRTLRNNMLTLRKSYNEDVKTELVKLKQQVQARNQVDVDTDDETEVDEPTDNSTN